MELSANRRKSEVRRPESEDRRQEKIIDCCKIILNKFRLRINKKNVNYQNVYVLAKKVFTETPDFRLLSSDNLFRPAKTETELRLNMQNKVYYDGRTQ